ncbi:hypothetical protein [Agromyces humi]|uniref:hypothetical protein n=1 Tax=Agromyces humi TaxID=1766800 RepID=UPI00135C79EF|nr:hypothetical protein [Agromyces humi]
MSAFADCFLCDQRITTVDDHLTDAEIAAKFASLGWTVGPTRCPEHVGLDAAPPREQCTTVHDDAPFVRQGMAASAQSTWWGPNRFAPREGTCRWYHHYAVEPATAAV